jgi:hypothetical protein
MESLTFSFEREATTVEEVISQTLAGPRFPNETRYFPSRLQDKQAKVSA